VGKRVIIPAHGVQLPGDHAHIVRQELRKRQFRQREVVAPRQRKELIGVHWRERPGLAVDGAGPIAFEFQRQEPSRPQSKLLGIEMTGDVTAPAVLPAPVLAAADDALLNLGQGRIEGHALLRPVIAEARPITGEGRARQEIARVWVCRFHLLRPSRAVE
jgi:hypothetical protein